MSPLPDDLDALSAGAPPVADWPGLVRTTVRARRRRRAVTSAAAVLSLVVVSGIGVVVAAGDDRGPSTLAVATQDPSPTPTTGTTENRVTVDITVSPPRPKVGEEVIITIIARGDKGGVRLSAISFDRDRKTEGAPSVACAQPEPVAPKPGIARRDITFVYSEAFTDTVYARADSGCGYYQGEGEGRRDVVVEPADGDARPTATATRPVATTAPAPTSAPARNVVSIDITVSPARPRVGEEVTITVVAQGDKGFVRFTRISFADGTKGVQGSDFSCAPASPEPEQRIEAREDFIHVYERPGDDTVLVEVDSGCGYYQGSGTKRETITVDPADNATNSPSPSPSPSPGAAFRAA